MAHRTRPVAHGLHALLLALLATLALAAASLAQSVHEDTPPDSAGRVGRGSCTYDGAGKLIFAPRDAECAESEQPPASLAPDAAQPQPAQAPAREPASAMQPHRREEIAALLGERELLDVELARVREAFAYEDREAARGVVEEALRKIARHLEHEARVLQPLATSAP